MPANIESLFYNQENGVPWHRSGTPVNGVLTAAEAIVEAGLDWEVDKQPIFLADGTEVRDKFATVRKSDNRPLGVVGARYTPIQNQESFDFLDSLVDTGEAKYETAGSLDGGRKIWLLAKVPGNIEPVKNDVIERYLCLFNSHDGTSGLGTLFTPTRVVCKNTLNMAVGQAKAVYKIRHTKNYMNKIEEAREMLGFAVRYYDMFNEAMKTLAGRLVNVDITNKFVNDLLPKPETKQEGRFETWANKQEVLQNLIESGMGTDIPGVRGTAYGLFNAATEFADHHIQLRGKTLTEAERLAKRANSILFDGKIKKFKNEATKLVMEMV